MKPMQARMSIFLILLLWGCTTPIQETIQRDMIILDEHADTEEFLEYLSACQVVVIGEYHGVLEHREFVTDLMLTLAASHGFRHFQTETSHAFHWMIQAYTDCTIEQMHPFLMHAMQVHFTRIREHNAAAGPEEMIHVYGIDINHNPSFLIASLTFMLEQELFDETDLLEIIIAEEDRLRSLWGNRWYLISP